MNLWSAGNYIGLELGTSGIARGSGFCSLGMIFGPTKDCREMDLFAREIKHSLYENFHFLLFDVKIFRFVVCEIEWFLYDNKNLFI